jgi:hypothetical protein
MRQILVLLGILFTLTLKAQEEFSRAYLNVLISYDDSLSFYSGANAFNPFSSRLQTSPLDKIYMETRETARYMFSSPSYVFSPSL